MIGIVNLFTKAPAWWSAALTSSPGLRHDDRQRSPLHQGSGVIIGIVNNLCTRAQVWYTWYTAALTTIAPVWLMDALTFSPGLRRDGQQRCPSNHGLCWIVNPGVTDSTVNHHIRVRNNESTKLRNKETTKVRNNANTKQRNCETTKVWGCETTKGWCETTKRRCKTTKVRDYETTKVRFETKRGRCETTKLRNNETAKQPGKQRKGDAKLRKGDPKLRKYETMKQRKCETTKGRCERPRFQTAKKRKCEMALSGHYIFWLWNNIFLHIIYVVLYCNTVFCNLLLLLRRRQRRRCQWRRWRLRRRPPPPPPSYIYLIFKWLKLLNIMNSFTSEVFNEKTAWPLYSSIRNFAIKITRKYTRKFVLKTNKEIQVKHKVCNINLSY